MTFLVHLDKVLGMLNVSRKLVAGAGSFVVAAGVSAVLLGTAGFASTGHSTAATRPASHQHVAIGPTGAAAIGLTLSVAPAPVHIAVQPAKVQPTKVTLTSSTKPKTATKSTDPTGCPGMGGSGAYDPGKHHGGGKPGGH